MAPASRAAIPLIPTPTPLLLAATLVAVEDVLDVPVGEDELVLVIIDE